MRGCLQWSNGVGLRDGAIVGALGDRVGDRDGAVVGDIDGLAVGDADGLRDGETLGLDVGASVLHCPSEVPSPVQAPRLSGTGAVHARVPRQSLSRQHPSPVAHVPGQGPPPSAHVSRCWAMLSRSSLMHSDTVGEALGDADGISVGDALGLVDGEALGSAEGDVLGLLDGANVLHAPRVPASDATQFSPGLLHSREPSQSRSWQPVALEAREALRK